MQQIYILLSQVCLAAVVKNGQGIWNHTECHLGLWQQALAVIHSPTAQLHSVQLHLIWYYQNVTTWFGVI